MNPDHVAAQVRERSGLDVQAVTLVRPGTGDVTMPAVWAAMTELGHFWAVEDGQTIELFRAVTRRTTPNDLTSCHSAVEAARRFLVLHPPSQAAQAAQVAHASGEATAGHAGRADGSGMAVRDEQAAGGPPACQACGAAFERRPQIGHGSGSAGGRALCPRCRHAERERLRYQQDPSYRARRLAYSAARYRRGQQASGHNG